VHASRSLSAVWTSERPPFAAGSDPHQQPFDKTPERRWYRPDNAREQQVSFGKQSVFLLHERMHLLQLLKPVRGILQFHT
jgi:hypothetical protein